MPDLRLDSVGSADNPSFEDALARLEAIVVRLESGDLPLEESLKQFEEGVRLSRLCTRQLDDAEAKIEILVSESGQWQTRPCDPDAGLEL
jgi:exodeoxyribonuclease VII small subunit